MFEKVLVPVDDSTLSEEAIAYLKALMRGTETAITLLHVIDHEILRQRDHRGMVDVEELIEHCQRYLVQLTDRVASPTFRPQSKLLAGPAAETIVDFSEREGYDLIAMSTQGESGQGRWALGSVTDRVLHTSRLPVLLVRPESSIPTSEASPRRVVVPLDGSEVAATALPWAAGLARRLDLEVLAVRAIHYPAVVGFRLGAEDGGHALEREAEEYLAGVVRMLEGQGLRAKGALLWGHPGDKIVEAVEADPRTIVVMSSHGRSGVVRWVLGSVTDRVVRALHNPVIVVPSRAEPGSLDEMGTHGATGRSAMISGGTVGGVEAQLLTGGIFTP